MRKPPSLVCTPACGCDSWLPNVYPVAPGRPGSPMLEPNKGRFIARPPAAMSSSMRSMPTNQAPKQSSASLHSRQSSPSGNLSSCVDWLCPVEAGWPLPLAPLFCGALPLKSTPPYMIGSRQRTRRGANQAWPSAATSQQEGERQESRGAVGRSSVEIEPKRATVSERRGGTGCTRYSTVEAEGLGITGVAINYMLSRPVCGRRRSSRKSS